MAVDVGSGALDAVIRGAEEQFAASNPKSAQRYEQACRVMPGGNTRSVLFYSPFPLTIAEGRNASVVDADGHSYVDFVGEFSAGIYGHSNPLIREAIETALRRGIVLGGPNEYEAELAEAICTRFPSIEFVRFCNSGTEANLLAICTARQLTGKDCLLAFEGGYHGGVLHFSEAACLNVPFPTRLARYNNSEEVAALIQREADSLAAILVEPMMGAAGCIPADPEFLHTLRALSHRHGIILIFDEVMTSRLAPGGVQGTLGIVPDMTTLGKYIGGGLSLGAFGGARATMERFDPRQADSVKHAGTFNNNVCSMAAGLAGLTRVLTAAAVTSLTGTGDELRTRLNGVAHERALPVQATGLGSLMNIHFVAGAIRSAKDAARGSHKLQHLFHLELLKRGLYIARRGFISLSLPMSQADRDRLVEAFDCLLEEHAGLVVEETSRDA